MAKLWHRWVQFVLLNYWKNKINTIRLSWRDGYALPCSEVLLFDLQLLLIYLLGVDVELKRIVKFFLFYYYFILIKEWHILYECIIYWCGCVLQIKSIMNSVRAHYENYELAVEIYPWLWTSVTLWFYWILLLKTNEMFLVLIILSRSATGSIRRSLSVSGDSRSPHPSSVVCNCTRLAANWIKCSVWFHFLFKKNAYYRCDRCEFTFTY